MLAIIIIIIIIINSAVLFADLCQKFGLLKPGYRKCIINSYSKYNP